ncbi:hypothetical protein [Allofournierella sp.]|uniref:hypothetical protein n=1 Tax=Allofournierella sp. TaxID=1940256 RepID=UPI003AB7AD84
MSTIFLPLQAYGSGADFIKRRGTRFISAFSAGSKTPQNSITTTTGTSCIKKTTAPISQPAAGDLLCDVKTLWPVLLGPAQFFDRRGVVHYDRFKGAQPVPHIIGPGGPAVGLVQLFGNVGVLLSILSSRITMAARPVRSAATSLFSPPNCS